jgi:hypothetical protein
MAGFVGTISALVGECITLSIYQRSGSRSAASAAVFFLFFHIACFSVTCDATSYIYASEIFPTPVRAKGLAISISGLFVATIIFLQCAPTAFAQIGWKYYTVFISCTVVSFFIVWFFCPEACFLPLFFIRIINIKYRRVNVLSKVFPSCLGTLSSRRILNLSPMSMRLFPLERNSHFIRRGTSDQPSDM